MGALVPLVSAIGLAVFVCNILVLMKMYPEEGILKTIFGFFCGIYAIIWGWQNADRLGIKNLVLVYTVLSVLYLVLYMAVVRPAVNNAMANPALRNPGTTYTQPQ